MRGKGVRRKDGRTTEASRLMTGSNGAYGAYGGCGSCGAKISYPVPGIYFYGTEIIDDASPRKASVDRACLYST